MTTMGVCLLVAPHLWGRDSDYGRDVREECRVALSGEFISNYSDLEVVRKTVQALELKAAELQKGEKAAEADVATARKNVEKKDYDARRLETLDGAQHRLTALQAQREETRKLLEQARGELTQKKHAFEKKKSALETLFVLTPITVGEGGGLSFSMQYRHSCGRYKDLCPLPREQAQYLSRLFPSSELPESCRKYSQIRQP